MKKIIKTPFLRQKFTMATLCIVFTLLIWSCKNNNEVDPLSDPLSDEQISFNLLGNGKTDPKLLIGEWDAIAFAYTADGYKILNRTDISEGRLKIPNRLTIPNEPFIEKKEDDWEKELNFLWQFSVINWFSYFCLSLSGNLIDFVSDRCTYLFIPPPHLEYDFIYFFKSAQSYVIKDNELIFYFPEIKDENILSYCTVIENKNLLILKKR